MKLLIVLMLIALPLSCFAGSGCPLLDQLINDTISTEVTREQYVEDYQEFINNKNTENAVAKMKQCFLDVGKNEDTLANIKRMTEIIYNSKQCSGY